MENENRYNLIFTDDEAFVAYMMVVFEDPSFTEDQLREIIVDAIKDGLYMYEKYDRSSPLPVYITQVVKTYIQDVKQYLNK